MENKQEYEQYIMLSKGAQAELVEKKSRFIATIRPVSSEEEAAAYPFRTTEIFVTGRLRIRRETQRQLR